MRVHAHGLQSYTQVIHYLQSVPGWCSVKRCDVMYTYTCMYVCIR